MFRKPAHDKKARKNARANKRPEGEMARFRERVYRLVAAIPAGRVATYGQIAGLAGHPRRARHVGRALSAAEHPELPWHRVINAQGQVSHRGGEHPAPDQALNRQRRLLVAEGIAFQGQRVPLEKFRWRPEEDGAALLERILRGRVGEAD